jgi:hypothetical protein
MVVVMRRSDERKPWRLPGRQPRKGIGVGSGNSGREGVLRGD